MKILQSTFLNNVSNIYFKAKSSDKNVPALQNNLKCDTFKYAVPVKSDVKKHITDMKYMLVQSDKLKPVEQERMLLAVLGIEYDYQKTHPYYYMDYRPSKALGDFYLKHDMPVDAITHYETAIDSLTKYVNDKKHQDIEGLRKISIQYQKESEKLEEYFTQLREYNNKNSFEKIKCEKPEAPVESINFLKNNRKELNLYKKTKELSQMYLNIGQCYKSMQTKPIFYSYVRIAKGLLKKAAHR